MLKLMALLGRKQPSHIMVIIHNLITYRRAVGIPPPTTEVYEILLYCPFNYGTRQFCENVNHT